jgi:hypothetical protein
MEHVRATHTALVRCNAGNSIGLGEANQRRVRIAATTAFGQEQFASWAGFVRRLGGRHRSGIVHPCQADLPQARRVGPADSGAATRWLSSVTNIHWHYACLKLWRPWGRSMATKAPCLHCMSLPGETAKTSSHVSLSPWGMEAGRPADLSLC